MNKKSIGLVLSLILGIAVLIGGGEPATAQTDNPMAYTVDQIIIKYKDDANLNQAAQVQASDQMQRLNDVAGVTISYSRLMSGDAHVLDLAEPLPVDDAVSMTDRLSVLPEVKYAEPNYMAFPMEEAPDMPFVTPNDTRYPEQWHYFVPAPGTYGMNAPGAWDITKGSASIYVAVLDTGITDHADLAGRWIGGYDMVSDLWRGNDGDKRDSNPRDPGDWIAADDCYNGSPARDSTWHGTHTAGTIGAATNNGLGVAGLNWVSKIVPVRVLGKCGNTTDDIADGIRWAAGLSVPGVPANPHPAKVINMSLGGYNSDGCSSTYQNAINDAYAAGSVVVVSAGNNGANASNYQPASCDNVITIAATNREGNRAFYSNYGSVVEISAPGGGTSGGVLSTMNTGTQGPLSGTYAFLSGTSMAAPHVSGVASLMYSLNPLLTPNQVLDFMQDTVTPFPVGSTCNILDCGSGIVNAAAALAAVPGATPATPTLSEITNPDGMGTYTVNWNDVDNVVSYRLQQDDNASFSSPTTIYNNLTSQYIVNGKAAGTWYYRVRAENTYGVSGWSNTKSTSVKPETPVLDPITNPGDTDAFTITWSSEVGADGYLLQEAITDTFTSTTTHYMGAATQYQITGQAGGDWYYRVQAYNDAPVPSDWSNSETVTVTFSTLSTPNLLAIVNSDQQDRFTVNWSDVPSATSYILEESDNPYFVDPLVVYSDLMTETLLTDRDGGTWHYRVRAANSKDQGPWSNSVSTNVEFKIFASIILNGKSADPVIQGPTPGYWEGAYEEFFVTPDGGSVDRFAAYVSVSGCGIYKITHLSPMPAIVSDQFSYSGSFYFSGTFNSAAIASGVDGLNNYEIFGCGIVNGGPWNWDTSWKNGSQPTFQSAEVVVPELVKRMPDFTSAHEVIKLDP